MTKNLIQVTLYTRNGCTLCEQTKEHLQHLQDQHPHRLTEVNIDLDPALKAEYSQQIPVVQIGPYTLKAPITSHALAMTLGAARDRRNQLEQTGGEEFRERIRRGETISKGDHFYHWISKHYLALLNLIIFLYVGLPFAAPLLMKVGATIPAGIIYKMYSPLCHQFGFRSFFLFGEQPYYPLKEAGLTQLKTFQEITGYTDAGNPYSPSRLLARQYVGDPTVGYKVALCERDVSTYAAILLFGLLYALTHRRLPALHWMLWILVGLFPIAVDGFSQLLSQFNWPWLQTFLPYRESTPFLRMLTGFLFGFTTAWFAYPNIEESMRETRQVLIRKFAVNRSA
jgi:uncharacterized membrane protein